MGAGVTSEESIPCGFCGKPSSALVCTTCEDAIAARNARIRDEDAADALAPREEAS